jgi:glutamine synthetase
MLVCADRLMMFKYIVKNTARVFGKTATFMPKPIFEITAKWMHTHQSLWKGENLYSQEKNM